MGVAIKQENMGNEAYEDLLRQLKKQTRYYSDGERHSMILQRLLLSDGNITIQDLAEETQTGRTTTIKDLQKCEKWLERNHLHLKKRARFGLCLTYEEEDWRRAVVNYINTNLKGFSFQNLYNHISNNKLFLMDLVVNEFLNELIGNMSFVSVKNFIRKFENDFLVRFTDEGFVNLFFYICISLKRVRMNRCLRNRQIQELVLTDTTTVVEWLKKNCKIISSDDMEDIFSEAEFNYLTYYMLSQNKIYCVEKTIGENSDIRKVVKKFLNKVEDALGIELSDDRTLFQNLMQHLEVTINRVFFDIQIENPLKDEIKETYPQVYKACIDAGELFEDIFHKSCSEDEISYLAMHVAVAVERIKGNTKVPEKIKAVVVCSGGVGTSNMVKARIINELPSIDVFDVYSVDELEKADKRDIDLIITTVPLIANISKPILYVSPFLQEKDIELLKKYVYKAGISPRDSHLAVVEDIITIILQECVVKDYARLYKRIEDYFSWEKRAKNQKKTMSDMAVAEHISFRSDVEDYTDAIRIGSRLLYQTGSIEEDYVEDLMRAKEAMGANIVVAPGVALLHAKPSSKVNRLSMSFLVLEKPVSFGNTECDPVTLVLTLAAVDTTSHLEILSELVKLIEEKETLQKLVTLNNVDDFRRLLQKFEADNYYR